MNPGEAKSALREGPPPSPKRRGRSPKLKTAAQKKPAPKPFPKITLPDPLPEGYDYEDLKERINDPANLGVWEESPPSHKERFILDYAEETGVVTKTELYSLLRVPLNRYLKDDFHSKGRLGAIFGRNAEARRNLLTEASKKEDGDVFLEMYEKTGRRGSSGYWERLLRRHRPAVVSFCAWFWDALRAEDFRHFWIIMPTPLRDAVKKFNLKNRLEEQLARFMGGEGELSSGPLDLNEGQVRLLEGSGKWKELYKKERQLFAAYVFTKIGGFLEAEGRFPTVKEATSFLPPQVSSIIRQNGEWPLFGIEKTM